MGLEKLLRARSFWIFFPVLFWSLFSWAGLSIIQERLSFELLGVTIAFSLFLIPTTLFWGINLIDGFFQSIMGPLLGIVLVFWFIIFYGAYTFFIIKIKKIEYKKLVIISLLIVVFLIFSIIFMLSNTPSL